MWVAVIVLVKTEYFLSADSSVGESYSVFLWDQAYAIPFVITSLHSSIVRSILLFDSLYPENIRLINSLQRIPTSASPSQAGQTLSILIRTIISDTMIDPLLPHL